MFTFSETDGVQVAPFFPVWDVFLSQDSRGLLSFYPFAAKPVFQYECGEQTTMINVIIHDESHLYKYCFSDIHKWSDIRFTIIIYYNT